MNNLEPYVTVADQLVERIAALVPEHPEILTMDSAWQLFKVPGFQCSDLQPSLAQASWARPDGLRRFVIGAERTTGESLGERLISFATLDPWKASLCSQARDQHLTLRVKYQMTRYFDANLLHVELIKDAEVSA